MITERDILKCVEELNELSTILLQQHNKPHKDFSKEIIEELGDVSWRLEKLIKHYGPKKIKERIKFKKDKSITSGW
jgi:hypothetical protein